MPNVLTTAGTAICGTAGTATLTSGSKLFAGGSPVMRESDVPSITIAGCKPKAPGDKTCTKAIAASAGKSTKLFVGGSAVLLETLTGSTDGTDATLKATAAGQSKLAAV